MKILCMKIAVWILRGVYRLFWPVKLKKKVVMLSRQSGKVNMDFRLLEAEFHRRGIPNVILCHEMKKSFLGAFQYMLHILHQMRHIADSSVVIVDGYCMVMSLVDKKEGQKVFQIWHSLAAIKKFGWQSVGSADGRGAEVATVMRMHRNYDYFAAPSEVTAALFAESFRTDLEKRVLLGLPRIDYIKHPPKKLKSKIRKFYPELAEKKTVLYAPTFRKGKKLELTELLEHFPFEEYNLVVKKHPLDRADYADLIRPGLILDDKFDTVDWFILCEKVITDYSGVAIEAAVAEKELYFYLPDRKSYSTSQGLNMNFEKESIRRYVCHDGVKLCSLLQQEYYKEARTKFLHKYISVETEHCTRDMADFVEGMLNPSNGGEHENAV